LNVKDPLNPVKELLLSAFTAQEAKWRARMDYVEENGGIEDMPAVDVYELIADAWHDAAEIVRRICK